LCFSGGADGIYGNFDVAFLRNVTPSSMYTPSHIPLVVLIAYQMMFAIITPALITGAFTNRITFKAFLVFLVVWQLFVYYPFVHMIWGNGLLAHGASATSPAASWCGVERAENRRDPVSDHVTGC
jgi:Amt family ammonium transporter